MRSQFFGLKALKLCKLPINVSISVTPGACAGGGSGGGGAGSGGTSQPKRANMFLGPIPAEISLKLL